MRDVQIACPEVVFHNIIKERCTKGQNNVIFIIIVFGDIDIYIYEEE